MTSRQRWTLVCTVIGSGAVFLDGTIVNAALKHIGQELPGTIVGVLEGQAYIVGGYLAVLAALLILAGALSDHYGRRGSTRSASSASPRRPRCAASPRPSSGWSSSGSPRAPPGPCSIPGSLALITHAFDGARAGARVRDLGGGDGSADHPRTDHRRDPRRHRRLAGRVPGQCPALGSRCGRRSGTSRSRATPNRPAGSTGSAPSSPPWPSAASRSVSSAARRNEWADTAAWIAIAIGIVALIAFPILMARRPHPLVPLELFKSRAFSSVNLATFFIYGGAVRDVLLPGGSSSRASSATRRSAPASPGLPGGIMLALLSTRIGTLAGRIGPRRFLVAGPLLMATGLLWYSRIPADSAPWHAAIDDPASLIPPLDTFIDILPYALLFGSGSRSSSPR